MTLRRAAIADSACLPRARRRPRRSTLARLRAAGGRSTCAGTGGAACRGTAGSSTTSRRRSRDGARSSRAQALGPRRCSPRSRVLALVSFFRKSVRAQVRDARRRRSLYLGFYKSQLISIVNIFALVDWNLPIFKYSLAWYLLAGFTVVVDGALGTAVLRPDLRVRLR